MTNFEPFYEKICQMPVYDTHEHLITEESAIKSHRDFFDLLFPYVCDDILSAGMPLEKLKKLLDKGLDFNHRWMLWEPYSESICHGEYFQAVKRSLTAFGILEINESSARLVGEKMAVATKHGYYRNQLAKNNISRVNVVMDDYQLMDEYDDDIFEKIPTVSSFCPTCYEDIAQLSKRFSCDASRIDEFDNAIYSLFEEYISNNVRAIKIGSGYNRTLDFKPSEKADAQKALDKISGGFCVSKEMRQFQPKFTNYHEIIALDNYITWEMLRQAQQHNMEVHIHTGIHAWNYNFSARCHLSGLTSAISTFSSTRFVLLHCGYPFEEEAFLLAKYYPNVALNMAWLHIIDSFQTRNIIERLIKLVPTNKIMAFGGDYMQIENIKGHLEIAKQNLAKAFYNIISDGSMSEKEALGIISSWLLSNCYHVC